MIDITEILIHWYAGRSQYELADSLGVDRKTIRKYLAPAVAAGMIPGGPPVSEADWAVLVRSWFPQLTDTRLRQVTWGEIAVHRCLDAQGTAGTQVPRRGHRAPRGRPGRCRTGPPGTYASRPPEVLPVNCAGVPLVRHRRFAPLTSS